MKTYTKRLLNETKVLTPSKPKCGKCKSNMTKQIRNLQGIHNQELDAKDREISRLNTLLEKGIQVVPDAQRNVENGKTMRYHWIYQRYDRLPFDKKRSYPM